MANTMTKKCIRCGKPAKSWMGHVCKRNGTKVTAGWCSKRCRNARQGYCGLYKAKYGEEPWEFNSVRVVI